MSAPTVSGSPLPPPPAACPLCGAPAGPSTGRCTGCGADLADPAYAMIRDVDRRWLELAAERQRLLDRLAGTLEAPPAPPAPPGAPEPPPSRLTEQPGRRPGIPALLAFAGVALLTAAAAVFTAVAWSGLPALGQAAILLAATVLAAVAALVLHRRSLPVAAGALGLLTMSFALVDVVGLERSGALSLEAFTLPVGAMVAAAVGWLLARAHLRWVSTAGAASVVLAAVGATVAIAESYRLSVAAVALFGTVLALLVALTLPAWSTVAARRVAGIGAATWMTVCGLVGAFGLAEASVTLWWGAAAVVLPAALLVGGVHWSSKVLAPAVLLATTGIVAAAAHLGAMGYGIALAAAAAVAAAVWSASLLPTSRRWPVLAGAAPLALAVAGATLEAVGVVFERLASVVASAEPAAALEPLGAATVTVAVVTLLALPHVRPAIGWVLLPAVVVLSGALHPMAAWPALLAVALVGAAVHGALRWEPVALLGVAVVAVGWAAGTSWTVAIAAATTVGVAVWVARRGGTVRVRIGTATAMTAAGLAVAAAADAVGASADLALGTALVTVFLAAVAAAHLHHEHARLAAALVAALATLIVPLLGSSVRVTGVLLLVGAAGWLALAVAGSRPAAWVAAVVASVGSTTLLADAGIEVVEAYTVVPVLTLGAVGLWWLARDGSVRTLAALSPGLVAGLLPSLMVLSAAPQVLGRTLGLTAAAGGLAFLGVTLRWLAPTLAGAATAMWVAATQLLMVVEVVPRWVTFAVVGILLVWLAATYEAQQARAGALRRRLRIFR
jgi:hypothetical protein